MTAAWVAATMDLMRWLALFLFSSFILTACGRSVSSFSLPQAGPTLTPPARPAAAPRSSAPASPGSLQLSGGVRGFLSLLAVDCSHAGPDFQIAMRGRVENVLYGLDITVPRPGEYHLGPAGLGPAVSVRLSSQPPAGPVASRWAAGSGSRTGAGALNVNESAGSIDADLEGLSGTGGSVHLQGSWTCG